MTQEEFHKRYQYNPNTDCLGEGGFGKVYKAYDMHLNHYVAIKMAEVKPHLEEVRLRKEVDLVNKLPSHPNIAHYEACYTYSTFAGEYDFGVLQYYDQGNLQQLITNKQLTYYQKDSMLKQILDGIVFLHSHGIIHRDLKPHNILIALNHNGVYVPKITDFGISKKLDVNKSSVFTNSLAGAGTLSFASPEQLLGNTIRKNTDLWSFGVIACWMFTGKLPFNSGSLAATSEAGRIELFKQITAGEITAILTQIPADWRNLVRQCLVVDAEKRVSGAGKCLEILSGKVEVLFENHKSENTSRNTTVTSKAATEAPRTTTNYSSTRTKNSAPKPTMNAAVVDANKSHLWRNIIIGVGVIASILFFVYQLIEKLQNSTEKNPEYAETVTDIDGNVYKTVRIGNQVWMAENLKVTHYRNGDAIPNIIDDNKWSTLTIGAYCNSNNNDKIGEKFGKLYNWYATNDARKIAPSGWHVATDTEWTILITFLGGERIAGYKLKETGTTHWNVPNTNATNETGFSAIPGGYRNYGFNGATFDDLGNKGFWWSTTKSGEGTAWFTHIGNEVSRNSWGGSAGLSVRCVRD